MKTTITNFQTADGEIIYRTTDRMSAANRAIKIAIKNGHKSLLAVEPDGSRFDYADLLNRYQHRANDLL